MAVVQNSSGDPVCFFHTSRPSCPGTKGRLRTERWPWAQKGPGRAGACGWGKEERGRGGGRVPGAPQGLWDRL